MSQEEQEEELEGQFDNIIQEEDIVQVIELDDNGGGLQKNHCTVVSPLNHFLP